MHCRHQGTRTPTVWSALMWQRKRSIFGDRHQKSQQLQKVDQEQKIAEAKRAIKMTDEVPAWKTTGSHNELQKVSGNEKVSQKHWNQAKRCSRCGRGKKRLRRTRPRQRDKQKIRGYTRHGIWTDGHDEYQNRAEKSVFELQPAKVQPWGHVQDELRQPVNNSRWRSNPARPTLIQPPGCGSCEAVWPVRIWEQSSDRQGESFLNDPQVSLTNGKTMPGPERSVTRIAQSRIIVWIGWASWRIRNSRRRRQLNTLTKLLSTSKVQRSESCETPQTWIQSSAWKSS